jgi:hypothetical protein
MVSGGKRCSDLHAVEWSMFINEALTMNQVRQDLMRRLETLSDEHVMALLEYIDFIRDSQDADPTEDDLQAITKGREEYARGEYVEWRGKSS